MKRLPAGFSASHAKRSGAPAAAIRLATLALAGLALASCQKSPGASGDYGLAVSTAALPVMERVALAARECWFRSGDAAFKPYKLSPELTSMTGKPRILIVPARNPNGLPLAVIEASGNPARLNAFGPMMGGELGGRIRADVTRWAQGGQGCGRPA
jgi:hypothetical protein